MSTDRSKLFLPCQPMDFYGLREKINEFTDFIAQRKKKEVKANSVLIVGEEGTGKSSFLLKLSSSVTGRKDVAQNIEILPEEESLFNFFKEWKNNIDELSPEWRSVLEKVSKKKLGDTLPSLDEQIKVPADRTYTSHYVELFFENLEKVNQKLIETETMLYFFIDNLQLFKFIDFKEFYPIYASILKRLSDSDFNIIVVSAFNEQFIFDFDYEKYLTDYSKVIKVEALSVSDTEIYLRRKASDKINQGVLDLVSNSQRTFFDLNLGLAFISAGLEIEDFVERDLTKLFELNEDEDAVLAEMSSYNENLFPIEQLTAYVSADALKSLAEKEIIWIGLKYVRLLQESLLNALKFRMRLFSPLTTLMVQLDAIIDNIQNDIAPSSRSIELVEKLALKIRDRLAYFAIAAKIQSVTTACMSKKMFQAAYDFALINAQQFEQINELEQAGGFCESIARNFEEREFYFAARLYVKSALYYDSVDEDLKANRSYARAADQFEKLAFSLSIEKNEYAVRGYIKWSLDCYRNMGDESNFERIRKKAIDLFEKVSIHHGYFDSMKYGREEETQIEPPKPEAEVEVEPEIEPEVEPEAEPEAEEVEEISIENIEKELDF